MLVVIAFVIVVTVSLSLAMFTSSLAKSKEYGSAYARLQRLYLAEAGVSRAILDLAQGGNGNLGTKASPVPLGAGGFRVVTIDNGDGTWTITSYGRVMGSYRAVQAVVARSASAFDHAMFAGNSSGDATYALDLGGTGAQADLIDGDIYSGQDVSVTGDASATGAIRARGAILGATGEEGISQPIPGVVAADFPNHHDVDVAAEFASSGAQVANGAYGGTAGQVPETMASHIFRKNPDARSTECSGTAKDDYFLEDPYEIDGGSSTGKLTLAGIGSEPGANGNGLVYYIDGNLWLHNVGIQVFTLEHDEADGVQVTIVVRGNIYMCDDLETKNAVKDGLALIAIKDENVSDSGNIYFGDPVYGKLTRMDAFMYAENDFYDNNLNTSSTTEVTVNGIMSAGNHVSINRDVGNEHTRLVLNYDDRVATGTLDLPGIPALRSGSTNLSHGVITVQEVSAND